jgi:aminomethyltransferase
MSRPQRTLFYETHRALGAKMAEFGGWDMPIQYASGTVKEHLATRRGAGLFDVSHMGRFTVRGTDALAFLQHVLTNDAEALEAGAIGAQYTVIPNESGGAVDDAYLCRFDEAEYLLIVNAGNRLKDWEHLQARAGGFGGVELVDRTEEVVMLALQGPTSQTLLEKVIASGRLPDPPRNSVSIVKIDGARVEIGRTGYTGEPVCFELYTDRSNGLSLWNLLLEQGATPVGLGARDTLRLEAGLPLYGHEFGVDPDGKEMPLLAFPLTRFALSFSPEKGAFVGKAALEKHLAALEKILSRHFPAVADLPRIIRPVALTGRGIARNGARVFQGGKQVGTVTSGTMVPYWIFEGEGASSRPTGEHKMRPICLAYLDSHIARDDRVEIEIRGKTVDGLVVGRHLRVDTPPYARPIVL